MTLPFSLPVDESDEKSHNIGINVQMLFRIKRRIK